jgi:hypothetical protein
MPQFNPSSKHLAGALQSCIILVGFAMNRQTLKYEVLSVKIYQKKAGGVLGKILGHVMGCISIMLLN